MNLAIIILLSVILIETTFLVIKIGAKRKTSTRRKVYVDTSALMDGRILSIAKTGFLADQLIIPRSVIRELQLVADGKDHTKRSLAREGMQIARDLERVESCDVEILQDELDRTLVDERLISLAKENHGVICTTDYNLCQVAATEHVETLNPNALTSALAIDIPKDTVFDLAIETTGAKAGQGVGHLDNGTMVVVSRASRYVGQSIRVIVRRTNTTDAGRIIFADPYQKSDSRASKTADGRKSDSRISENRKSTPRHSSRKS